MALGALIGKARLGLADEELVEQIKENPYRQFFIGLEAFQYSAPYDPSMMVYFRKRLPESVVNDYNARIVRHGLNVIRSASSQDDEDNDPGTGSASSGDQPALSCYEKPSPNQGTRLIDATCVPAAILHPADLSLLNEAREATENLVDAMNPRRYGHSQKVICADQIYRTRSNRAFCQRHGIRLSGPCLGCPKNDPQLVAEEMKQFADD
jgi:transposase, IS5 family